MDRVARVCGLEEPKDPSTGCGASWTCCPTPMPSDEKCVTDSVVKTTTNINFMFFPFILISTILIQ